VLRYWEQEFTQLKPMKRRGNRRYYQHHEVLLVRRIRELLYDQGFTISGARNRLSEHGGAAGGRGAGLRVGASSTVDVDDAALGSMAPDELGGPAQPARPGGPGGLSPIDARDDAEAEAEAASGAGAAALPHSSIAASTAGASGPMTNALLRAELRSILALLSD
ncbi:MAG: MerR family transcriptional regulator, partial [Rubrivivax sp.]